MHSEPPAPQTNSDPGSFTCTRRFGHWTSNQFSSVHCPQELHALPSCSLPHCDSKFSSGEEAFSSPHSAFSLPMPAIPQTDAPILDCNFVHDSSLVAGQPQVVGARLAASKPLRFRGQGLAVTLPWHLDRCGLVVVIDLWSGFSGTIHALLSLGFRCVAIAAESDSRARAAAQKCFPAIIHVHSVESVSGEMLRPILVRRTVGAILVGGGAPCPENSSLNAQATGRGDPRTQQVHQITRITQEIQEVVS